MSQPAPQSGSLTIEVFAWNYATLAARSKSSVSTLRKYVHWGLLREGEEYMKRSGYLVWFHPEKAMTRLAWIWENRDVLREAKKEMARRVDARRRAEKDQVVRDRTGS